MTQHEIETVLAADVLGAMGFDVEALPYGPDNESEEEREADAWAIRIDQARARIERLWD